MYSNLFLLAATAVVGLASGAVVTPSPTACNANNCLRQVRASAFPTRMASSDCSVYQTTYSTSLTTVTVAGATASTPAPSLPAPAPTKPSYASSCTNDAAYRSACSCNGQTSTVIVAATSTVTVTTTAAAPTCTTFALRSTDGIYPNRYFVHSTSSSAQIMLRGIDPATSSHFDFRGGNFYAAGSTDMLVFTSYAHLDTPTIDTFEQAADFNNIELPLSCVIAPGTGALNCGLYFQTIAGTAETVYTNITPAGSTTGFHVVAVPVC